MWCFRAPGRLAGLWITAMVIAAPGLTSCTHEVLPGSPGKSNATLSVDPGAVLLDANTIDDLMGTTAPRCWMRETHLTTQPT